LLSNTGQFPETQLAGLCWLLWLRSDAHFKIATSWLERWLQHMVGRHREGSLYFFYETFDEKLGDKNGKSRDHIAVPGQLHALFRSLCRSVFGAPPRRLPGQAWC
jgi:hypothetical protein